MKRLSALGLCIVISTIYLSGCSGGEDSTTTNNYVTPIPVRIVTPSLSDGTEGYVYSATLLAVGGAGSFTWSLEAGGTNDSWLSIDNTGALSGTPGSSEVGAVTIVVKAVDPENATNFDVAVYSFDVAGDPSLVRITTTALSDAFVGYAYSKTLSAEGGSGAYTWSKLAGGTNDAWVAVQTTGVVAGTPTSIYLGPVTLKVRVADSNDPSKASNLTYHFDVYSGTLTILSADPLPNAAAGQSYSTTLLASGGSGTYGWSLLSGGTNDAWLSLDGSTGVLSGTAPSTLGPVSVNVSVSDTENAAMVAVKTLTFSIKTAAITTDQLPTAFVGTSYAQALSGAGFTGTVTWSIEPGGSNYGWLQISGSNLESITQPASGDRGAVTVLVKADDGSNSDVRPFQFNVVDPVTISTTQLPDGNAGVGYSQLVSTSGGTGKLTFSIESGGTNDAWLSIDADTGRLSGLPTAMEVGSVSVVVKVTETDTPTISDQQTLTFDVNGVQITTTSLPDASVGSLYDQTPAITGGSGYYAWSVTGAPAWLNIDPDTGRLTGTPTAAGAISITVDVYDPLNPTLQDQAVYTFWAMNSILRENFDTGAPLGWTAAGDWARGTRDPSGTVDRYYTGPRTAQSGNYVYGTNLTGNTSDSTAWGASYVQTTGFNLSSATNPWLEFYQWFQFEAQNGTDSDGGRLQYSTNGGGTWNDLTPLDPAYTGTAGGQTAWTGHACNGWRKVLVDLSAAAGQSSVQLRWINYGDADGVAAPGWYIDSVHVFDVGASAPAPKTADSPFPADGSVYAPPEATDYTGGVTLSWEGALGASSYQVYVGTDQTAVQNATPASLEYRGSVASPAYTATFLSASTTYYWRVDGVGTSTTAGTVWSFGTSNPVAVFINEVQTTGVSAYLPYVELYNPSATVTQDLSGFVLNTTLGGVLPANSFTIPSGIVLAPGQARVFGNANFTMYYYPNYRAWDVIVLPFDTGWTAAADEAQVWLTDPSGIGVDYMGVNVVTSNCPADLVWTGSITSSTTYRSCFRRTDNTDTDDASDFRVDYFYNYGSAYGYMGEKDAGQ